MSLAIEQDLRASRSLAEDATRRHAWVEAAALWQDLAETEPGAPEASLRLAEALFFLHRHAEAMQAAQRAAALAPQDIRPLILLARAQSGFGSPAAAAAWEAVLQRNAEDFEAWARLAQARMLLAESGRALAALLRALALRPDHPFGLGLAAALLRGLSPEERQARLREAAAANTDAGLVLLQVAVQLDAADPVAAELLAARLLARNAYAEAIEPLTRLVEAQPDNLDHRRNLARALHRAQRWAEASRVWQRVLKLRPADLEAGFRLAQSLRLAGHPAEAVRHYEQTLKRYPAEVALLRDYSTCLAELGRAGEADAAWAAALALRPGHQGLRLDHAAYLMRHRRHAEAASVLEAAVGPKPGFDRASLLLLRLMQTRGEAEAALHRFAPIIATGMPPAPDATAREVGLRLGLILLGRGRLTEAATLIEPAHTADPADRLGIRAMLNLLLTRGAEAEAQALAARVLDANRMASWAWREIILAFAGSEQAELAAAAFEEASALFRDQPAAWLDIAEAAEQDRLGRAIREKLADLVLEAPADRLRASRLALREGALDLAARLLGEAEPGEALAEEWGRHKASLARARELLGPRADAELAFPDIILEMLAARAGARAPQADSAEGPVVLANSSLAGGGAERQIALALRGLAARLGSGEGLHLVCTRLTESAARRVHLPAVREAGVSVTDLAAEEVAEVDLSTLDPVDRDLLQLLGGELSEAIIKLYGAFRRLRPRVVHLWQDRTSIDGAIAALLAGVPRILLNGRSTRPVTRQRLRGYMPAAYRALLRLPQVIACNNSLAGARDYEGWLGLPEGTIHVVHNGFEFDRLSRAADPARAAQLRAQFNIPPGAPVLGGVLRLSDVKRPLLWVEAAARAVRARPDLHLVLAGEGPLLGEVQALARRLGIAERLRLPGHVEVAPWYRLMDVVLLTSRTEGLPNVLVEAQSLGRPVVSTRVGGMPETVIEGVTGWSVPPEAPDLAGALAEKVLACLNDRTWAERARREAARFATSRFGREAMVQRLLELYGMAEPGEAAEPAEPETLPGEAERAGARAAMEFRDWSAAAAAWEAVLAALPVDAEALLGIGQARFRQERMAEARAAFARALRLAPGEEPLRWLARSLRALGEEREALALWEQLLEAEPRDLEAWLRSAEARARLGDLPAALAATEEARRQLGSNDQLLRLQARLQTEAGNLDAAFRHWTALAEANPADSEAQFRLGQLAQRLGEEAQAERRLRAALAAPRPVLRAAGVLARLLSWTGRMREARAVLRAALRRAPAEPELWQSAFEWLRAGARHAVVGRYLRALERRAGTDPEARLHLAERMTIAESPDRAAAVLRGLLDRPEVAPAAAERLARLLLRQGEVDAAIPLIRAPGLPPALRAEVAAAGRIAGRMRAETDEAEPMAAFATLVARSARRRVHPRYLPKPGSVLHVINSLALGGSERQCSAMARAQAAAGREVMVLRTDPGRAGRATFFLPELAAAGIASGTVADHADGVARALAELPDLALPAGGFAEALRPRQVGGLASAIRALRPESIVAWSPQCMADAALAAMALGVPRIVIRSGSVALPLRDGLTETETARYRLWRATLRALLLEGGGVMLNNCAANLAGWNDWLGLPEAVAAARCGVLPNIVDAATLQPGAPAAVAALRDRLGIPGGVPVIGSVMRLEQEKGVDLWLGIVRAMRALRPDAVFLVAGDGRMGDPLRAQLAAEGLAGAVRLAGRVGAELPLHYSLMDALLLTSSVEGLPNAVVEAQCFGLPVVAPRVGGVAEAVAPEEADHVLLASRDPSDWCAALAAALAAPERRAERLARGRRFITGRFAAPAVLARLDQYLAIAGATA
ncbi:glycosyltransferase [Belnapia sp. T6]|uniref:Glycosyltransferase n=1 Tax=Belnapia mucosa TaxID=2804532 RepID=A0ABS1VCC6_9PROT|nr:glycosyltransferase [Belnapia mucosa]MBL6459318.1 glycosyltransferase [Belnapia mucosa]